MLKRPEAILFDMGGVLLESVDMWTDAGFEKSYPNGLPNGASPEWFMGMSRDILARYERLPAPRPAMDLRPIIAEWLPKAGMDASAETVEDWYGVLGWWEVRPLYPFVREALKRINDMGYRIGLISNTLLTSQYHRDLFRAGGIFDLFEFMVFSAEFGANKPDPRIFRHALDAMKLDASCAWYVGDKPHRDVCGAHGVGMTAVLVDGPYEHRMSDSPAHEPDVRVRDISELPELLVKF
ncbi:MAG: HAD family hydrolase [Candidatus Hydrogenedentes bacterium]|nr:HAD family hydrolase [Candidatus Hydrogenedentota bacterium]